jgi:D-alanyl-D-alanine carboxypeptidase
MKHCLAIAFMVQVLVAGPPGPPSVTAKRAALIDPVSERILFQKAADEKTQAGSIGKLMTAYVTFWAVDQKLVSWNDKVALSLRDTKQGCTCMNPAFSIFTYTNASNQPCAPNSSPSCTGKVTNQSCKPGITPLASNQACQANGSSAAKPNETFFLKDLMKISLNESTGESTDAVAEHVAAAHLKKPPPTTLADSDAFMNVFLGLMNQRSKALGLSSVWYTVHGGGTCDFTPGCNPDCQTLGCNTSQCPTGQVCANGGTSALDVAKLWSALAKFPNFLEMIGDRGPWTLYQQTNLPKAYGASPFTHWYGYYPGLDGDKNGETFLPNDPNHDCFNDPKSGPAVGAPCWTAQATRAGRPLIASALQADGFSAGVADLAAMFRYGFSYTLLPQRVIDSGAQKTDAVKDHRLACSEGMCFSAYRTTDDQLKFTGWNVSIDDSVFDRVSLVSVAGSPVSDFDIAYQNFSIVAGYVSNGNVKLASYQLSPIVFNQALHTVKIDLIMDTGSEAGSGTRVRLVPVSDDLLVSVVTDAAGALRLTSWRVDIKGKLTRLKDTGLTAQVAKQFAAAAGTPPLALGLLGAPPPSYELVTATTTQADKLRLYSWSVSPSDGAIAFQKSSLAVDQNETASNIDISSNRGGTFGTSLIQGNNSTGTHEIVFWAVDGAGSFTRRFSSTQGSESASETAIAPLGNDAGSAYLTAIEQGGETKLIVWDLPQRLNEGSAADYRVSDSGQAAGPASALRMAQMGGAAVGDEKYVTALKEQDGTLKLIGWSLGKTIGVPIPETIAANVSTPSPGDAKCKKYKQQLADDEGTLKNNYAAMKTAEPGLRHTLAAQNKKLVDEIALLKAKLKSCPAQ